MEIAVQKEVLEWALDRAGRRPEQLRKDFPKLAKWLSGEGGPSMPQLRQLASKLHVPLGFLFLKTPPQIKLPIALLRTRKDIRTKPSPEFEETVFAMEKRKQWLRSYIIESGNTPLNFIRSCAISDNTKLVADRMRQALGLERMWASRCQNKETAIKVLREAIENAGGYVFFNGVLGNASRTPLDPQEFLGFVLCDEYAPVIFVNNADFKSAQLFTLAHEFAHLLFGLSAAFDFDKMLPPDDPGELACNHVAAEFLVPEDELSKFASSLKAGDFNRVASTFKVSEIVIARKALDSGYINKTQFFAFYERYAAFEKKESEASSGGGSQYTIQNGRVGKHFASTIRQAIAEDRLLYSEAYSLTGLRGNTFDEYIYRRA